MSYPPTDVVWWDEIASDKSSGVVVGCRYDAQGVARDYYDWRYGYTQWRPDPSPPPSPQEFEDAVRLYLSGVVTAPGLGVWPGDLLENDSKAMGAVGLPVWLWDKDAGPGIGQPLSDAVSVRGHDLRVEVSFVKTVWDLGDGATVACGLSAGPGNRDRHHASPSPYCGHVYVAKGDYVVTATTQSLVRWSSSAGRAGQFPLTVDRSGAYHVGEIQAIIVTSP
jgi:hypothetical protein